MAKPLNSMNEDEFRANVDPRTTIPVFGSSNAAAKAYMPVGPGEHVELGADIVNQYNAFLKMAGMVPSQQAPSAQPKPVAAPAPAAPQQGQVFAAQAVRFNVNDDDGPAPPPPPDDDDDDDKPPPPPAQEPSPMPTPAQKPEPATVLVPEPAPIFVPEPAPVYIPAPQPVAVMPVTVAAVPAAPVSAPLAAVMATRPASDSDSGPAPPPPAEEDDVKPVTSSPAKTVKFSDAPSSPTKPAGGLKMKHSLLEARQQATTAQQPAATGGAAKAASPTKRFTPAPPASPPPPTVASVAQLKAMSPQKTNVAKAVAVPAPAPAVAVPAVAVTASAGAPQSGQPVIVRFNCAYLDGHNDLIPESLTVKQAEWTTTTLVQLRAMMGEELTYVPEAFLFLNADGQTGVARRQEGKLLAKDLYPSCQVTIKEIHESAPPPPPPDAPVAAAPGDAAGDASQAAHVERKNPHQMAMQSDISRVVANRRAKVDQQAAVVEGRGRVDPSMPAAKH